MNLKTFNALEKSEKVNVTRKGRLLYLEEYPGTIILVFRVYSFYVKLEAVGLDLESAVVVNIKAAKRILDVHDSLRLHAYLSKNGYPTSGWWQRMKTLFNRS